MTIHILDEDGEYDEDAGNSENSEDLRNVQEFIFLALAACTDAHCWVWMDLSHRTHSSSQ